MQALVKLREIDSPFVSREQLSCISHADLGLLELPRTGKPSEWKVHYGFLLRLGLFERTFEPAAMAVASINAIESSLGGSITSIAERLIWYRTCEGPIDFYCEILGTLPRA